MQTQQHALAQLPTDAKWSCSFGYPGQQGFTEYYRQPDGTRWILTNGPWHAIAPDWQIKRA